jgi:hypothetical protein
MNQASNGSFNTTYSVGTSPLPAVVNVGSQNLGETYGDVVGRLSTNGAAAATVSLYWGPVDGLNNASAWTAGGGSVRTIGAQADGATFTNTLTGLAPNATNYWNYSASNASGTVWAATAGAPFFKTLDPVARRTNYVDSAWTNAPGSGTPIDPYVSITLAVSNFNANPNAPSAVGRVIYVADGLYAATNNGGQEVFGASGLTAKDRGFDLYGGYVGMSGGVWNTNRTPRTTVIDLTGAGTRAIYINVTATAGYGCLFDGITIQNANFAGSGGAISSAGGDRDIKINDCLFSNNVVTGAGSVGGAVYWNIDPSSGCYIRNSDFIRNSATNGGAIYALTGYTTDVPITNCLFDGNAALVGGAVYVSEHSNAGGNVLVEACRFTGNSASSMGGALFSYEGQGCGAVKVRRCLLTGNASPSGAALGGSAYWSGQFLLENCLIASNTGSYAVLVNGWRFDSTDYELDMTHCTVAFNPKGGVSVTHNYGLGARIRDCIIATNGIAGVYYNKNGGNDAILLYNDVWGNPTNYALNATNGTGSISSDPRFVSPATNDLRLQIGSPCIDAATNLSFTTDLVGTVRPTRNGYDMGCYEERAAIRVENLQAVTTTTNATLRGKMTYDGLTNAWATIYWGTTDGGTNAWENTNYVGLVAMPNTFQTTVTVVNGQAYFFRCFASNVYDGVWADASLPFEAGVVYLWTGAGTNALASNPSNWFGNVVPSDPAGTVKLDNISSNLTWDVAALHTVGGWVQTPNYTGTVTIATGWTNGFDRLVVSGNMSVSGGTLTHLGNSSQEVYRLALDVGGNFTLDAAASLNVDGKGYAATKGPGGATVNQRAGSHGGQGYFDTGTPTVYGDLGAPTNLGSGGYELSGGGAVWLSVGGTGTVNGIMTACGQNVTGNDQDSGAGGSIYLRTGVIAGSGALRVNAALSDVHNCTYGGGGRVALIVTNATGFGSLTLRAGSTWSGFSRGGAAGTVYKQSTLHAPNKGILIIDNYSYANATPNYNVRWAVTPLPANYALADFAQVVITNAGMLGILPGQSFNFGTDLANVSFAGVGDGGSYITVRDAAGVTFPNPFTVSNYTLRLDTPVTATGDWTIAAGGRLSHSRRESAGAKYIDLTLTGNLTVNGSVDVRGCGYPAQTGPGAAGSPNAASYGGLGYPPTPGKCYGSILNPDQHGSSTYSVFGGGRVKLTVSGNTAVNGTIQATSMRDGNWEWASGGTVDLRSGTLSGAGGISARGGSATLGVNDDKGGGGGRIAVRLTNQATLGGVTVLAPGGMGGSGNPAGANTKAGGAGTVYIEKMGDAAGAGTLIFDNTGSTTNVSTYTELPPVNTTTDDLSRVTMILTNGAWVKLRANVGASALSLAAGTRLDLNGYTGTVAVLTITNRHFMGMLTASQLGPIIADSSSGGTGLLIAPAPGSVFTMR